jgi:hypothetical protein
MDYSLADLTRLTAAKRRTVQLWAEAGIVHAIPGTDKAGTGTHRRFSREAAILACLLNAFAQRLHMPIGVLFLVSRAIRIWIQTNSHLVERAIQNRHEIFLVLKASGGHGEVTGFEAKLFAFTSFEGVQVALNTVVKGLESPGSFSLTIMANPHLRGFTRDGGQT